MMGMGDWKQDGVISTLIRKASDFEKFVRDHMVVNHSGGDPPLPIDFLLITRNPANPATYLGYGTWALTSEGRVPVGWANAGTFNVPVGTQGGAETHTLLTGEMPSHNHTQDAHNHTQDAHNHTQDAHNHAKGSTSSATGTNTANIARGTSTNSGDIGTQNATATNQAATATNQAATATNQAAGGGGAHNNLQPYMVWYMYVRTA